MSAAASVPLPQQKEIRGFCPVGLSYFERLLTLNRFSEIKIFSLILVETLGKPGHPTWAEITDDQFAATVNVSKEQYFDSLIALGNFGYIQTRTNSRGRREYAVAETFRDEAQAKKIHGRCPHCSDIIPIDYKFIPIPHIVLRKLTACLDAASFACLMVILRYTLHVNKERGVYALPAELDINDFTRLTQYDPSSITKALAKLCDEDGWALVQRKIRKGKPSIFCPVLDKFYHMERREARVISMPANREKGERSAKVEKENPIERHESEPETEGIESNLKPYGFCRKCDRYVAVNPVSEAQFRKQQEESPPRAGPGRQKQIKTATSYRKQLAPMPDESADWESIDRDDAEFFLSRPDIAPELRQKLLKRWPGLKSA